MKLVALYHDLKWATMNEIVELSALSSEKDFEVENEQAKEVLQGETVPTVLNAFVAKLESMETFGWTVLAAIKEVQKKSCGRGKNLFMPIRGYEWTNTRPEIGMTIEEAAGTQHCTRSKPHFALIK